MKIRSFLAMASALTSSAGAVPAAATSPAPAALAIHAGLLGQTTLQHDHFAYAVAPGASMSDSIVLSNIGAQSLEVDVYGADLLQAQGGGVAPAQKGAPTHEVGSWLRVSRTHMTIAPEATQSDAFSIAVPSALSPGEYLGAVVAETTIPAPTTGTLTTQTRAALIVDITIPGALSPSVRVGELSWRPDGSGGIYQVTVRNTGNLLATLAGSVTVNLDDGRVAGDLTLGPTSIYVIPGGETTLTATWRNAPRFAHVRSVANIRASFARKPQQMARSSGISFWIIDWLTVAVGALLVALMAMVIAMRRRFGRLLQEWLRERRDVRSFKANRRARR